MTENSMPPAQEKVTRRRFLAWVGAGAGAAAVGGAGIATWINQQDQEEAAREASLFQNGTNELEERIMFFSLSPRLGALGKSKLMKSLAQQNGGFKDLAFNTPYGEYPVLRHNNETWARFKGENHISAKLDDKELIPFYLADPKDLNKPALVKTSRALVTPGTIWANIEGTPSYLGGQILLPKSAITRTLKAGLAADSSLLRRDLRLRLLKPGGLAENNADLANDVSFLIMNEDEAIDLDSVITATVGAATSQIFNYPGIMMMLPEGARPTLGVVYGSGGLKSMTNMIELFDNKYGLPCGQSLDMVKYVDEDGNEVPQTFDPRYNNPLAEELIKPDPDFPPGPGETLPELPPIIENDEPMQFFVPFIRPGSSFVHPITGRAIKVADEDTSAYRGIWAKAIQEVNNYIQGFTDQGVELTLEESPAELKEKLAGKQWFTAPTKPVGAVVSTPPASNSNDADKYGVNWQVSPGDFKDGVKVKWLSSSVVNGQTLLKLSVQNHWPRYLDTGIIFYDSNGYPISPKYFTGTDGDEDKRNFSSAGPKGSNDPCWSTGMPMIPAVSLVYGVPLTGEDANRQEFEISLPPDATTMRIVVGGGFEGAGSDNNYADYMQTVLRDDFGNIIYQKEADGQLKTGKDGRPIPTWITPYAPYTDANGVKHGQFKYTSDGHEIELESPAWYAQPRLSTLLLSIVMPSVLLAIQSVQLGFTSHGLRKMNGIDKSRQHYASGSEMVKGGKKNKLNDETIKVSKQKSKYPGQGDKEVDVIEIGGSKYELDPGAKVEYHSPGAAYSGSIPAKDIPSYQRIYDHDPKATISFTGGREATLYKPEQAFQKNVNRMLYNVGATNFALQIVWTIVIGGVKHFSGTKSFSESIGSVDFWIGIGKTIFNAIMWSFFSWAFKKMLENKAWSWAMKAIPIAGEVFMATAVASDIAEVTQGCLAAGKSNTVAFDVSSTYSAEITVKPENATFSKSAWSWYAVMEYPDGLMPKPQQVTPPGFKWGGAKEPDKDGNYSITVEKPAPEFTDANGDWTLRNAPFTIHVPAIPVGGKIRWKVVILSQQANIVGEAYSGTGQSDYLPNYNLAELPTKIEMTATELEVPFSSSSSYVRSFRVDHDATAYTLLSGAKAETDTTEKNLKEAGITASSLGYGERTGQMTYIFQRENEWNIHQLEASSKPGAGFAQFKKKFSIAPLLLVDPFGKEKESHNWLLEPNTDKYGQVYYNVRRLLIGAKKLDYLDGDHYGRFTETLAHVALSKNGTQIVGLSKELDVMHTLDLPVLGRDDAANAPVALQVAGPGSRPGTLNNPRGVVFANGNYVVVLEEGDSNNPPQLQALDAVSFQPTLAFKPATGDTPEPTHKLNIDLKYTDIQVDRHGFIFLLGHRNNGATAADYELSILEANPKDGTLAPLFKVGQVNIAKFFIGAYRDLYSMDFKVIKTTNGDQPSLSIWTPRTPKILTPAELDDWQSKLKKVD